MTDSIKKWAQAGDPNAMIKLAEIYLSEGKVEDAKNFLTQAAEKNYRPAAKILAKIFEEEKNIPQAVKFYKQAVKQDELEAMEKLAEICKNDSEMLDFIIAEIDKHYNEIYFTKNPLTQSMVFGSIRIEEYLPGQAKAIERRRIKNEILKLKEAL